MSRVLTSLTLLVAGTAAFVGWQSAATSQRARRRAAVEMQRRADEAAVATLADTLAARQRRAARPEDGGAPDAPRWLYEHQARRLVALELPAPERDASAEHLAWQQRAPGTYLAAVASENAGRLVRWRAPRPPLRVWVQPYAALENFRAELPAVVRGALRTWSEEGAPFGFTAVEDSTRADVLVFWADHFSAGQARRSYRVGVTNRITDPNDWIVAASIALAVNAPDASAGGGSRALDIETIQNAARHELGHVLGLDHSPDRNDIMAPWAARQERLSDADRATLQLLYALPPGEVRP